MKSEIQRNYENDQIIFEKKQTGSSNQFIIDYQLLPTIKKVRIYNIVLKMNRDTSVIK